MTIGNLDNYNFEIALKINRKEKYLRDLEESTIGLISIPRSFR